MVLKEIKESLLHLFFPHVCDGCGTDGLSIDNCICLRCINELPHTGFENLIDNPVEKIFWGRIDLNAATAQFYFTKESLVQRLMHELKYRGNKEIAIQLGRIMGEKLKRSGRFNVDTLVPLPLFPSREKKRGYNQATVICQGISEQTGIPILQDVISRPQPTATQTRKSRIDRWKNIEGKFQLEKPGAIENKHLLLIDDVVTTGATLEACGSELLKGINTKLSIATLCFAYR